MIRMMRQVGETLVETGSEDVRHADDKVVLIWQNRQVIKCVFYHMLVINVFQIIKLILFLLIVCHFSFVHLHLFRTIIFAKNLLPFFDKCFVFIHCQENFTSTISHLLTLL